MDYKYILINSLTGIIEGDISLSGPVEREDYILVDDFFDPTNKKYDFEINDWVYYEPEIVEQIIEPSQLDRIEAALNQSQQEMIDREIDKYTLDLIENGLL